MASMLGLMVTFNMWRFRWICSEPGVPLVTWWWLPWVRIWMGLATDTGRFRTWLSVNSRNG